MALVIANAKYTKLSELKNPANDARLMANTLKQLNFDVTVSHDLDLLGLWREVESFSAKIRQRGPETVGLVFYSGHGLEESGDNYIVPVGADIRTRAEIRLQALSVKSVADHLATTGNQLNIFILDACRDNPFRAVRSSSTRGFAPMGAVLGVFIFHSFGDCLRRRCRRWYRRQQPLRASPGRRPDEPG
jgi:uncharacterized caspase-like protein